MLLVNITEPVIPTYTIETSKESGFYFYSISESPFYFNFVQADGLRAPPVTSNNLGEIAHA